MISPTMKIERKQPKKVAQRTTLVCVGGATTRQERNAVSQERSAIAAARARRVRVEVSASGGAGRTSILLLEASLYMISEAVARACHMLALSR